MNDKCGARAANPGVHLRGSGTVGAEPGTHQHPHAAPPRIPWKGPVIWELVLVGRGLRGSATTRRLPTACLWTPGPGDLSDATPVSIAPLHSSPEALLAARPHQGCTAVCTRVQPHPASPSPCGVSSLLQAHGLGTALSHGEKTPFACWWLPGSACTGLSVHGREGWSSELGRSSSDPPHGEPPSKGSLDSQTPQIFQGAYRVHMPG